MLSNNVPINLYWINVILCPDGKKQRPKAKLPPSKVPALEEADLSWQLRQSQVPTSCPAVIPEGATYPAQLTLSLLRPPK